MGISGIKLPTSDKWTLFGVDLAALLSTWLRVLCASISPEIKAAFQRPTPRIVVTWAQGKFSFDYHYADHRRPIDQFDALTLSEQPDSLILNEISQWGSVPLKDLSLVLNIDENDILKHQLELPIQVEGELRSAVGFQIEKLTPFRSDQVYFDLLVTSRNRVTKRLWVELLVLPKLQIDTRLQELSRVTGLPLDRITTEQAGDSVNLLGETRSRIRLNRNAWLLLLLGMSVGVAVLSPLIQKRSLMLEQKQQIEALREGAAQVMEKKLSLEGSLKGLNYLMDKKLENPPIAKVIDELSRIFPDEAYVPQLKLKGGEITLKGQGKNVVALIAKLEASPIIESAKFTSAVNRNARTGLDSFSIQLVLARRSSP